MPQKKKKIHLTVGAPFTSLTASFEEEEKDVSTKEMNVEDRKEKTRHFLSLLVSIFGIISITVCSVIGIYSGSFGALQNLWSVLGPIFGG